MNFPIDVFCAANPASLVLISEKHILHGVQEYTLGPVEVSMSCNAAILLYSLFAVGVFLSAEWQTIKAAIIGRFGRFIQMDGPADKVLYKVFHWQYTGVAVGILFAAGVSVAIDHRFTLAYCFFCVCGLLALCWWLFGSNFIHTRRRLLRTRQSRNDAEGHKQRRTSLYKWAWGVSVLIVLIMLVCINWAHDVETEFTEANLKKERDDVFDHLSVQPMPFLNYGPVRFIDISIVNGGHAEIDQHTVSCNPTSLQNAYSVGWDYSYNSSHQQMSQGLLGGGRGETVHCNTWISVDPPVVCADLWIGVNLSVVGQPQHPSRKEYRFSYGPIYNGMGWSQQSLNANVQDYCDRKPQ